MKIKCIYGISIAFITMLAVSSVSRAAESANLKLCLPAILSDNMVLQQDKNIRIWGWASPGQVVQVKIGDQKKRASTNAEGKWQVKLDPLKSGGPYDMVVEGGGTLAVKNILVGEVWLFSGQSNMTVTLSEVTNGSAEVQSAKFPLIRIFLTHFHAPDTPAEDVTGHWITASPETVGGFSGLAFLFGRELHQKLKVPVGLIQSAQGASVIEDWIGLKALQSDPAFKSIVQRHDEMAKDTKGWDPQLITGLYNGEIAPLTPFSLRGIIWYQGESNSSRAYQYRTLFPLLIRDWRRAWEEELPFYFVQLVNFGRASLQPGNSDWAELREAQSLALNLPYTGMAVAIDVGEPNNIHPKNKQDVAHRLALWAFAKNYGQNNVYSGPLFKTMKIEGDKIRLFFDHTGSGLAARGSELKGFAIAGEDHKFVWATAQIDGDAIVVSNEQVSRPVDVRYAWANNPEGCNLYNKDGLPASPFRTDTLHGSTFGVTGPKPTGKPWIRPTTIPVDQKLRFTGNTLEIHVGKNVARSWDDVRAADYIYEPKQAFDSIAKETHIWLPFGNVRGCYYEVAGLKLTDPEPYNPPSLISQDSTASSQLTLKFHYDKPISGFRFTAGPAEYRLTNAVAGIEYSVDGRKWVILNEVSKGRNNNNLSDSGHKITGLNSSDLFVRCYARDKDNPSAKRTQGSWIKVRTAGAVSWGDASVTYFQAQWQLWVTSAD